MSDPLIHYIKVARDQLSHRRGVLWHSEHGPRPMDAGEAITREGAHAVRDHNRYAAAVLPTLVLDLIPTEAALVPIEERVTEKGKKASLITVPVPVEHDGRPLTATDPTNCALAALKYYGEVLQGWASNYREKYYREKFR